MIFANLFRRKARTILTLLGIGIGIAAIVALGAVAQGMRAGFNAMAQGSQADLVLTQADSISSMLSSVDQAVADELRAWPEVAAVDGVLMTNTLLDGLSYLFIFGYDPEGFAIEHFKIIEGQSLAEAGQAGGRLGGMRGRPIILGHRIAESLDVKVGDAMHFSNSAFRVVGIYETGDEFEDGGGVLPLVEAQALVLQPRRVSMLYVQLRDPGAADRLRAKVERRYPDLALSTSAGFADQEQMFEILDTVAMTVAGLAVVIGGLMMTNTLFMSVLERTREIGLLRSLGWRRRRVLGLILGESILLTLLGALLGMGLGVASVYGLGRASSWLGALGTHFSPDLFVRALVTALLLGLVGGAYPAWWASRLLPVEALHYEGGARDRSSQLPGGMVVRNLWRRRTRTGLTVLAIAVGTAAVVALSALAKGGGELMTAMWRISQTDLVAIQADVDSDFSAIDERVGARIEARPDVEAVSGTILTAINTDEMPMLIVFGYHPRSFAIRHFRIVEGQPITASHQVIVGKQAAEQMGVQVGDTLRLLRSRFRIVGIFETGLAYEEIGVVIGLREAQALMGKPRQVMYYAIKLHDPSLTEAVRDDLAVTFPDIDFSLTAEAVESMSDFRVLEEMMGQISFLAIMMGGMGMLNTMLMSVLERTREVGVLRALGWRRRRVLGLVVRESLVLGLVGGACGVLLGVGLTALIGASPGIFGSIEPVYTPQMIVQAVVLALLAGVVGGLYPAWRATRMRPVEALRYE